MAERDFYGHLREGEYALIDYPVEGVSLLPPYGNALLSNLETHLCSGYISAYESVELPKAVPESFTNHLDQKTLFHAHNNKRDFYLSGSGETQAALLGSALTESYRDLPLRFYSRIGVFRENDPTATIKNIEYTSYELNSFFASKEEAESEKGEIVQDMSNQFKKLGIPFVTVNQKQDWTGPTVLYGHFPFSDSFGSLFWCHVVGDQYSRGVSFKYQNSDNETRYPIQVNGGFTSRVLPSYLSAHQDEYGFILQPSVSPTDILVPSYVSDGKHKEAVEAITARKWNTSKKSNRVLFEKFGSMGMPLMLHSGNDEIKVTYRVNMSSDWVSADAITDRIFNYLEVVRSNSPATGDLCDKLHLCDEPKESEAIAAGLKKLGYFNNGKSVYVQRKY